MSVSTELQIQRIRHPLEIRPVTISAIENLTPHLRRITFQGDTLNTLISAGFDDHVKLLLPPPGETTVTLPPIGPDGRPDRSAHTGPRPIARDYTPHHVDHAARTVQIDFSLHGDGPAARWAAQAQVGDAAVLGGPRGSMVVPTDLQWQWLIGDESAWPAITRRLAELPASVAITVVLESDALDAPLPPLPIGPNVRLLRVARPAPGSPLDPAAPLVAAVQALTTPQGRGHVFAAAESRTVKAVREVLVLQHRLDKGQIRAAAYWQRGVSDHHENLEG